MLQYSRSRFADERVAQASRGRVKRAKGGIVVARRFCLKLQKISRESSAKEARRDLVAATANPNPKSIRWLVSPRHVQFAYIPWRLIGSDLRHLA
jgi:hypothetical protein